MDSERIDDPSEQMTQVPRDRQNAAADDSAGEPPLFVDLDGTLIKSDLLIESFLALAMKDPRCFLLMPFWLLRGKAHLKEKIAERVDLVPGLLPFNPAFLEFLRDEAGKGRVLILATASDQRLARKVADQRRFTLEHGIHQRAVTRSLSS